MAEKDYSFDAIDSHTAEAFVKNPCYQQFKGLMAARLLECYDGLTQAHNMEHVAMFRGEVLGLTFWLEFDKALIESRKQIEAQKEADNDSGT